MKKKNSFLIFVFLALCVLSTTTTQLYASQTNNSIDNHDTLSGLSSWKWNNVELVSSTSYAQSNRIASTVEYNGNIHVVWVDQSDILSAGPDNDIFYKKWNVEANSWSNIAVLSIESDVDSVSPDIAVDVAGNVHVVWRDAFAYVPDNSVYDIFYKKWNVFSKSWETTQYISVDSTDFSYYPYVAVDLLGNVHVAWTDATTKDNINYRRWNNATLTWTSTEIVSVESSDTVGVYIDMHVDLSNNLHIVYTDNTDIFSSGTDYDLYYKKWSFSTSSWSALELVSVDSQFDIGMNSIDVDSQGYVHATWSEYTDYGGAGSDADIWYKYRDPSTGTWSAPKLISWLSPGSSSGARIAVDTDDVVHIVWSDQTNFDFIGNDNDIFYSQVDSGLLNSVEVISSTSNATSIFPDLCIDGSNYIHVFWEDSSTILSSGIDKDIFYRCYNGPINSPILSPIVPNPTESSLINLDWTDVSGASNYYVYRSTSFITDISSLTPIATSPTSDVTDNLPLDDVYYYYVIVAENAVYNSTISNCQYVLYEIPSLHEFAIVTSLIVSTSLIVLVILRYRRKKA